MRRTGDSSIFDRFALPSGLCSRHVRRAAPGQGDKESDADPLQLNLELAKLEGKQKATAAGIAGGLAIGVGVLVVYAIGFVFAAIAAGLNEALSLWLSLLIVAVILFLLAALAGFLAMRFVRKASPPTPTQAIEEATRTVATVQSHV